MTEGDFVIAQMYPGFEDPTQVPIIPGDTERPMYTPQQQPQQASMNGQVLPNQLQQVAQMMEQIKQLQQAALTQPSQPQNIQSPYVVQSQQNVQPIRVPLVFDLTFNLTINLNINPIQNNSGTV
jgi:hypothetical protein